MKGRKPTPLFPDACAGPRKATTRKPRLGRKTIPALPRDRWFEGPVLALDPSSTAVGWARISGGKLVSAGVIRAPEGWDVFRRTDALADKVAELAKGFWITRVVMEYATGMHHRATAVGVAACCHAQGAIRQRLRSLSHSVEMVAENDWTRGLGKKEERVKAMRSAEPWLAKLKDKGGDAADAAGLGLWWIQRNEA